MTVSALHCPQCRAPVPPEASGAHTCRYCSVTIMVDREPAKPTTRPEEHFVLTLQVGPSNVNRVNALLAEREIDANVHAGECRIDVGSDATRAHVLAKAAGDAGAIATVASYWVAVPLPVDVSVHLEDAGKNKIAVIAALREHVQLSLIEARRRVEHAPSMLVDVLIDYKAQALVDAIARAGGRAVIR